MKSRSMFMLIAAALTLVASEPVQPLVLEPTGKWVVDYEEGMCVLSRKFGTGADAIELGLRPTPLMQNGELVMLSTGGSTSRVFGHGQWWFDDQSPTKVDYRSLSLKDPAQRITILTAGADLFDAMKHADTLSMKTDRGRLSFRLRSIAPAITVLSSCQDDLLGRWGLDPVAFRAEHVHVRTAPGFGAWTWFGPSEYPADAMRTSAQGRSVAVLTIDKDGKARGCRTVESAGNTSLDQATCKVAMLHGRFAPAERGDGQPVASWYILPVRWTMPS